MKNKVKQSGIARRRMLCFILLPVLAIVLGNQYGMARPAYPNGNGEATAVLPSLFVPLGWSAFSMKGTYSMGMLPGEKYNGEDVAVVRGISSSGLNGVAQLVKTFPASDYAGKRVRVSGYTKAQGSASLICGRLVSVSQTGLGISSRSESSSTSCNNPDWKLTTMVLDLEPETLELTCGAVLGGSGEVMFSGIRIEVVDSSVPVTVK